MPSGPFAAQVWMQSFHVEIALAGGIAAIGGQPLRFVVAAEVLLTPLAYLRCSVRCSHSFIGWMTTTMQVANDVLSVLSQATFDGNNMRIELQLDRSMYNRTNAVVEAAGGVWNRKAKAHVFAGSAEEAIELVLLTGNVDKKADPKKIFQFFPTPTDLAKRLLAEAGVGPGMHVGEPQAGSGRIAREAVALGAKVTCVEIQPDLAEALKAEGIYSEVICGDFLEQVPVPKFDAIVANPPFALQADIKHTLHGMQFLKPGAPLVTVMSAGIKYRNTKLAQSFRDLVARTGGTIVDLPEGTFSESGTEAHTVLVKLYNR